MCLLKGTKSNPLCKKITQYYALNGDCKERALERVVFNNGLNKFSSYNFQIFYRRRYTC